MIDSNASPDAGAAVTPSGPAASSAGTIQPAGEAGQGATGAENFLPQGVDLNSLPPAVRAELDRINKEMVRGFTAKTQKLAEDQKKYGDYDTLKERASLYDQIAQQDEFVNQWNDFVKKQGAPPDQANAADPNHEIKKQLEQMQTKFQEIELKEFVDAFAAAKDEKGQDMNPDFDVLNGIQMGKNQQGQDYSLLRACVELSQGASPQDRVKMGYQAARKIRDQILEEGRKQGMGKMLSKVRNSTEAPTITSDKGVFTGDPKSLTTREARELAEKGIVLRT